MYPLQIVYFGTRFWEGLVHNCLHSGTNRDPATGRNGSFWVQINVFLEGNVEGWAAKGNAFWFG